MARGLGHWLKEKMGLHPAQIVDGQQAPPNPNAVPRRALDDDLAARGKFKEWLDYQLTRPL
jgi:hypothetical protein